MYTDKEKNTAMVNAVDTIEKVEEVEEVETFTAEDLDDDGGDIVRKYDTLDEYLTAGYQSWRERRGRVSVVQLLDIDEAAKISRELLNALNAEIKMDRAVMGKIDRNEVKEMDKLGIKPIATIPVGIVSRVILDTGEVKLLTTQTAGASWVVVKRYEDGKFSGIWQIIKEKGGGSDPLRAMAFNLLGYTRKDSDVSDVVAKVKAEISNPMYLSKYVRLNNWPHYLVPCFNGVYDGRDHSFTRFDAPNYEARYGRFTFTNKLDTGYNGNAVNVPKDFDPIAYIRSLCPDGEEGDAMCRLLLQSMQFAVRRFSGGEGWVIFLNNVLGKAAGHNGKSTFMEFVAFIIEHAAAEAYAQREDARYYFSNGQKVVNLAIDKWGDRFELGPVILTMWMLVSDESSDGKPIKNMGAVKNMGRRNRMKVEAKFQDSFVGSFPGTSWHAQNDYTMTETKDDASMTHRLDYSFERDFSEDSGAMSEDIKNVHIVREDVAEYMLRYLLEMPFVDDYDKNDLQYVKKNTEAVRRANLASWRFFDEVLPAMSENVPVLPTRVLYDMYGAWCRSEGQNVMTLNRFQKDLADYCKRSGDAFDYLAKPWTPRESELEWLKMQHVLPLCSYYLDKIGKHFSYVVLGDDNRPTGRINTDWLKVQYQARVIFNGCKFWQTPEGMKCPR